MNFLTAQEQKVLFIVLVLLVVGMAVKAWHSADTSVTPELNGGVAVNK
jgi:hypothetical protein